MQHAMKEIIAHVNKTNAAPAEAAAAVKPEAQTLAVAASTDENPMEFKIDFSKMAKNSLVMASVNRVVTEEGCRSILDGGATHSVVPRSSKLRNVVPSTVRGISDCHGNTSKVTEQGTITDEHGATLDGALLGDVPCKIHSMCEWLRQFDGSIEYFNGAAFFNPTNGDSRIKVAIQRDDGLFDVLRLPPQRYKRSTGSVNVYLRG